MLWPFVDQKMVLYKDFFKNFDRPDAAISSSIPLIYSSHQDILNISNTTEKKSEKNRLIFLSIDHIYTDLLKSLLSKNEKIILIVDKEIKDYEVSLYSDLNKRFPEKLSMAFPARGDFSFFSFINTFSNEELKNIYFYSHITPPLSSSHNLFHLYLKNVVPQITDLLNRKNISYKYFCLPPFYNTLEEIDLNKIYKSSLYKKVIQHIYNEVDLTPFFTKNQDLEEVTLIETLTHKKIIPDKYLYKFSNSFFLLLYQQSISNQEKSKLPPHLRRKLSFAKEIFYVSGHKLYGLLIGDIFLNYGGKLYGLIVGDIIRSSCSKLKGQAYFYYGLFHKYLIIFYWKTYDFIIIFYWKTYDFIYPLRKIYYVSKYHYEKIFKGMHRKRR